MIKDLKIKIPPGTRTFRVFTTGFDTFFLKKKYCLNLHGVFFYVIINGYLFLHILLYGCSSPLFISKMANSVL